jgi:hypothetical protein
MAENNNIDENDLNELLRSLPLEENNKIINEEAAEFIMAQEYHVNIDPEKEQELIKKLQENTGGSGGYKLYLAFALVMGLSICSTIYFKLQINRPVTESADIITEAGKTSGRTTENNFPGNEIDNGHAAANKAVQNTRVQDTFGRVTIQKPLALKDSADPNMKETAVPVLQNHDNNLPFITEQDKIRYKKIKNMMLQKLAYADKTLYAHIEADKMQYNGKSFITDAFTLRNMGITNLEYKTFLADLLIQNKREDYFTAQILNNLWVVYGYNALGKTYFQDEKYNDFPVVNVTIDGAKLYCKWLEDEMKVYYKQNNIQPKPFLVRLPFDYEWLYAARQGFTRVPLDEEYNTIFDDEEGLVDKHSFKRIKLTRKSVKRKDTLYPISSQNHYGWKEQEMLELYNTGFKYYNSLPGDTIYSERMKIFGKIGHVSEIVNEKRSGKIWYIGTSWKSKEDYLKLQNEFKTVSASPFVGFRPVIINTNDREYQNPFR